MHSPASAYASSSSVPSRLARPGVVEATGGVNGRGLGLASGASDPSCSDELPQTGLQTSHAGSPGEREAYRTREHRLDEIADQIPPDIIGSLPSATGHWWHFSLREAQTLAGTTGCCIMPLIRLR